MANCNNPDCPDPYCTAGADCRRTNYDFAPLETRRLRDWEEEQRMEEAARSLARWKREQIARGGFIGLWHGNPLFRCLLVTTLLMLLLCLGEALRRG